VVEFEPAVGSEVRKTARGHRRNDAANNLAELSSSLTSNTARLYPGSPGQLRHCVKAWRIIDGTDKRRLKSVGELSHRT
jgi:hypothetical protein